MTTRCMLCIDELTCQDPAVLGLEGESLEAQGWLDVQCSGAGARASVAEDESLAEVWVASCDDVEAINLAATLKSDRPDLTVSLVGLERDGSLLSRAHTARIDEVLTWRDFVDRYGAAKARALAPLREGVLAEAQLAGQQGQQEQQRQQVQQTLQQPQEQLSGVNAGVMAPSRARGFLMPVVSGSGGAGKSTVAVLSALIAQEMGLKTLLLDYDLQFGDAAFMAGVENPLAIDVALAQPDRLESEVLACEGLACLAAPARLETAESLAAAVPSLVDRIASQFDVIIANTGATWGEQHAALLERSTAVLFLVDQRSSSVRASRHALELCSRCGIATGQFQFVLNRCAKNAPLTTMDASCALQGVRVLELRDGGRDVEEYMAAGAAAELLEVGNDLCTSLQRLLADVLPTGLPSVPATPKAGSQAKRRGRHTGKRKGWGK